MTSEHKRGRHEAEKRRRGEFRQKAIRRRRFLIASGVAAGSAAAYLASRKLFTQETESTGRLVSEIEGLMEINKEMSREEVAAIAYQRHRLENPNWMKGVEFENGFINSRNQIIKIRLNNIGEPDFLYPDEKRPEKKSYPKISTPKYEVIFQDNNYAVFYGSDAHLKAVLSDPNKPIKFLGEYFGNSQAETNVLHFNFHPPDDPGFKPRAIGRDKTVPKFDPKWGAQTRNLTYVDVRENPKTDIVRNDIVLNLVQLRDGAEFWGIDLDRFITSAFANEIENLLESERRLEIVSSLLQNVNSNEEAERIVRPHFATRNEASSSLVGLLALEDTEWANIFLGGQTYKELVPIIINSID